MSSSCTSLRASKVDWVMHPLKSELHWPQALYTFYLQYLSRTVYHMMMR